MREHRTLQEPRTGNANRAWNSEDQEPTKYAVTDETLKLKEYSFSRWGGPRHNWWTKGLEEYWEYLRKEHYTFYKDKTLFKKEKSAKTNGDVQEK